MPVAEEVPFRSSFCAHCSPGTNQTSSIMSQTTTLSNLELHDAIWQNWNAVFSASNATTTIGLDFQTISWQVWNETAEEREARWTAVQQQREEAQRRQASRERRYQAARKRAEELLVYFLSDEQRATRERVGWFEVTGSKGNRYRIRTGTLANVDLMSADGTREMSYCAHPPGVPEGDVHLAQMLALVNDEEAFCKVANIHYRRPALQAA